MVGVLPGLRWDTPSRAVRPSRVTPALDAPGRLSQQPIVLQGTSECLRTVLAIIRHPLFTDLPCPLAGVLLRDGSTADLGSLVRMRSTFIPRTVRASDPHRQMFGAHRDSPCVNEERARHPIQTGRDGSSPGSQARPDMSACPHHQGAGNLPSTRSSSQTPPWSRPPLRAPLGVPETVPSACRSHLQDMAASSPLIFSLTCLSSLLNG